MLRGGAQVVNAHSCCQVESNGPVRQITWTRIVGGDPRPKSVVRRCLDFVGFLVPGSLLLVLPKCPLCLAAYLAAATGVGISLTGARLVQILLAVVSIASLSYVSTKHLSSST